MYNPITFTVILFAFLHKATTPLPKPQTTKQKMGNCIMHQSPMQWGGEDWGSSHEDEVVETASDRTFEAKVCREVKVKISKKRLQELVGKADLQELTAQELVAQLLAASARDEGAWRPRLQTIPEPDSFGSSGS